MEIFSNIHWFTVILGWFLSYALGALWFSPLMFLTPWRKGLGTMAVENRSFAMLLISQAVVSFFFAVILAVTLPLSLPLAVLISLTVAGMVKSYGLYSGKTIVAISVESTYIIAQAAIIILTVMFLK